MSLNGKLLLVSAAAGSGKTSVLTERIIRTLTDREHPADLSRLLVVTFTRAAAAELKGRIAAALSDALAEHPGDAHLSRQLFLLGSAQISTIDSFFGQAVRANFEQLGLPASFRVADAGETDSLNLEVLDGVIRDFYTRYESHAKQENGPFARLEGNRFADLMNHLLSNRSDTELDRDLLDYLSRFSSYPEGIGLLRSCADDLRHAAQTEFFSSAPGKVIRRHLTDAFAYYRQELCVAGDYLKTDADSAAYFSGVHALDTDFCQNVLQALKNGSYGDVRQAICSYQKTKFPSMRSKPPQMEAYKRLRDDLKTAAEHFRDTLFGWSPDEIRAHLTGTAELCDMLYELFTEYRARIFEEKKSRGILEFDDVRELLYRLLTLPDGSPSPFARTLSEQYDAVYIDEYQDVDGLQDRIFSLIGENRRFMVGDIKQSIYGFRGSEPSIFAGYRKAMPLHTDPGAAASDAVCVFMSENFRCDQPVIEYANRICSFLFSACEDSVGYRPQDDLVCAKAPPQTAGFQPNPVQTVIFEPYPRRKKGETAETDAAERPKREAVWVAAEISRLIRTEALDDGSRIRPSDIAILVRNSAHGADYAKELEALGIPVSAPGSEDVLHSPLMTDTLNLLRSIDNPYRDLPLSEYLLTPNGGFTLEELTAIRAASPEHKALYDAITAAAQSPELPCHSKSGAWVEWLEEQRKTAAVQPADRFLRLLYLDPHLLPYASEPELLLLYEQARIYQRTSWCGLYGFLDHFSKLLAGKSVSTGGFRKEESAVRIMTVHHSKGLEFPVVFLCACGSRFNTDSLQDRLLFHRRVGCACKLYRPSSHENENTVLREAVKLELADDQAEENIRTLYVALTRARERMYVTGTVDGKLDTALASASLMKRGSRYSILSAGSNLRWILAALHEKEESVDGSSRLRYITLSDEICGVPLTASKTDTAASSIAPQSLGEAEQPSEYQLILERQAQFRYPLKDLQNIPTKAAASRLRPDLLDTLTDGEEDERALNAQLELMQSATPAFESLLSFSKQPSAADIGTATHCFLEFCDLRRLPACGVDAEVERLVSGAFLSPDAAAILRRGQLEAFAHSTLIRQAAAAKEIYREQTFHLLIPLSALTRSPERQRALSGQTILVQGSIDLLLRMHDGRLLLFDYKTDHITDAERENPALLQRRMSERHGNQLACYAYAVRQLFGAAPDEIYIYSLPLGRTVQIDIPSLS